MNLNRSKSDVYGECVQQSLADLINKIEGAHNVTLGDEGLFQAIDIAGMAAESAAGKGVTS